MRVREQFPVLPFIVMSGWLGLHDAASKLNGLRRDLYSISSSSTSRLAMRSSRRLSRSLMEKGRSAELGASMPRSRSSRATSRSISLSNWSPKKTLSPRWRMWKMRERSPLLLVRGTRRPRPCRRRRRGGRENLRKRKGPCLKFRIALGTYEIYLGEWGLPVFLEWARLVLRGRWGLNLWRGGVSLGSLMG